jgi:hypothetical protein
MRYSNAMYKSAWTSYVDRHRDDICGFRDEILYTRVNNVQVVFEVLFLQSSFCFPFRWVYFASVAALPCLEGKCGWVPYTV